MTILYFTSTGNSLYAAKRIGGRLVSIPQARKQGNFQFEDDAIGLVFPVYGLCVPPLVEEFIKKATLKTDYLFGILTYGFYDAAALEQLAKLGEKNGLHFSYLNIWKTVENYLPGFEMEKEQQKSTQMQQKALDAVVEDIRKRKVWCRHSSMVDRFMTWTHKKAYAYPCGEGLTGQFKLTESCHGCGICTQVCPMDNIRIENNRPVFAKQCVSCLACTQNCPQNAIRMTKEKSQARYRCPEVTLQELINANR